MDRIIGYSYTRRLTFEPLEARKLMALAAEIIADLNTAPSWYGSEPYDYFATQNLLFYTANTAEFGYELWRTDGTSNGTALVKDINPGGDSSEPRPLASLGKIYLFSAYDEIHGRELWKSDGTAIGTKLLKDITAGTADTDFAPNRTYTPITV